MANKTFHLGTVVYTHPETGLQHELLVYQDAVTEFLFAVDADGITDVDELLSPFNPEEYLSVKPPKRKTRRQHRAESAFYDEQDDDDGEVRRELINVLDGNIDVDDTDEDDRF